MYLRKTIVLVALAAVTAAPSALALRPPIDAGNPGTHILTHESGVHHKKTAPQPKLCVKGQNGPTPCLAFGF